MFPDMYFEAIMETAVIILTIIKMKPTCDTSRL